LTFNWQTQFKLSWHAYLYLNFEATKIGFTKILVSQISEIISIGSPDLIFTFTTAITVIFVPADYINLTCSLEIVGSIDRLIDLLGALKILQL
jgi:hypothetical protein